MLSTTALWTPVGYLFLEEQDGFLTRLAWNAERGDGSPPKRGSVLERARRQLQEYFSGERRTFDLPLAPRGTDFQHKVWRALCDIPYGETISYGELARRVEQPKAARAVGMANNRNPLAIFIPCHRVVGADGKLVGYAAGLSIKSFLLDLERARS